MLTENHRSELETGSAISPEILEERGYRTITNPDDLPPAFAGYQRRSGLLVPIRDTTGEIAAYQLKADDPRTGTNGKPLKYETATGGRQCLDVPARSLPYLGNPSIPLWITEGAKKVDSGLSHGVRSIVGLQGVYGFRYTNQHGGKVAIPDFESIALNGREVILAFDSDVTTKPSVRDALDRLSGLLKQRRAKVRYLILPDLADGSKCGLDDWFAHGHGRDSLVPLIVDRLPEIAPEWEAPVPLDDPTGPPFPVDALPGIIGDYVAAVAEETQTSLDMAATVALGTISAAAGGKYEVTIPEQGWREPVHAMFVTVAEPASRKSGVFRLASAPIAAYERHVQPDERKAFGQWESRLRMLEKALSTAENNASKPPEDGKISNSEAVRMAAVDALEIHRAGRPRITQIITDDATPEAVKSLLAEQGGAIAAMSAESSFLSNTAGGRYSDTPNLDVLLNGHAGDSIRVDRKGRPSEIVERACLTLCLMVQPDVIRDLGKAPGFVARGGAARILPSFPNDTLGRRRVDVDPVPPELVTAWSGIITKIVARTPGMQDGSYIPWPLSLSPGSIPVFRAYRSWHEPQMSKDGAFADIRDWAGKQPGAVLRIAGLLHIAQHDVPETVPISADTLERAISITGYFELHTRVMYRLMRGRSEHSDAASILGVLRTIGDESVTKRDLYQRVRYRAAFQTIDSLNDALATLEDFGWIRRERQTGPKGGRPSEAIFLNPETPPQNTQNLSTGTPIQGFEGIEGLFPESQPEIDTPPEPDEPADSEPWSILI